MSKTVTIQIQGQHFHIHTTEEETYLNRIAAQLDVLTGEVARACPMLSRTEQLILVGLEQQDQICALKKENASLQDKLEHYNIGEGLGCIADYRETLSLTNQKIDTLQREADALKKENVALRAQLEQTFATLSRLAENSAKDGKESNA